MKMKSLFCLALIALLPVFPGCACKAAAATSAAAASPYQAGEFTVDVASTYTVAQPDGLLSDTLQHGKFGVAVGGTYWFKQYFGIGLDAVLVDVNRTGGAFVDSASASLTARLPLGNFAPYAVGGAGRNFETDEFTTHAGVGLEYRITQRLGAFTEARYTWQKQAADTLQFRAGVRFSF